MDRESDIYLSNVSYINMDDYGNMYDRERDCLGLSYE